ncbi:MAG: hypothetical protein AAF611_08235 [Bacteroidota bacterium]
MFKKVGFIVCILCLLTCEQQPKQTVKVSQKTINQSKETLAAVEETDFEPFDASDYLSMKLLIGKSAVFQKEKIHNLHVEGYNSYDINPQGLITAQYDISNNYSEYSYTKAGLLKSIIHKQHTPAVTYYTNELFYAKDGTLQKSEITKYNQQTKQTTKQTVTASNKLQKNLDYFKVSNEESFTINRKKRIIRTYKNDLFFCCGETMPGKNKLQYYYNQNQLIDSLVINGLDSKKKMTFVYKYSN